MESKMALVAEMFGKKLNERFTISRHGHKYEARFLALLYLG